MGKRLQESTISTRAARTKLPPGLHWRAIDPDVHLGYRRGAKGGVWIVRWRTASGYNRAALGTADDIFDADGQTILNFTQAMAAARQHVSQVRANHAEAEALKAAGPTITVRAVIETYLTKRDAREAAQKNGVGLKKDARSRLTKHVFADENLSAASFLDLTEGSLKAWLEGLPATMAPSTTRRLANDLKAALNDGLIAYRSRVPAHLAATIRHSLKLPEHHAPVARDMQLLSDGEIRKVIAAALKVDQAGGWDGDLARMVMVLAATGARFSQVTRLTVADVQVTQRRLLVPVSRKGRGGKASPRTAVAVGPDLLEALSPLIVERKGSDPLLLRPRWKQVGPIEWENVGRGPWRSASELTRPWAAIVAEAGVAARTVPYALRHSSIVRGLKAGLPVRLVAALHDTSTPMIERHYSAFIVDALEELSARAVIPLTGEAPLQGS